MPAEEHPWKHHRGGGAMPAARDPRDWVTGDEPITPRQRKALLRLGYREDLDTITKAEAGVILRRELHTLGGRRSAPTRFPEDAR